MSRLTNDVGFIQTAAQAALNTVVRDTLSVIALVASMFYLDWVISLDRARRLSRSPPCRSPLSSKRLRRFAKDAA